jgi:hypothetical protein
MCALASPNALQLRGQELLDRAETHVARNHSARRNLLVLDDLTVFWAVFVLSTLAFLASCSSSHSTLPDTIETIAASGGTPQSAPIGGVFMPLTAKVTQSGLPLSGVLVTFTAPATGASVTFTGEANTVTSTTDANGNAIATLMANGTTGGPYAVTATAPGASGTATFNLTNTTAPIITATSGASQNATVGMAFAAPLQATVTSGGLPTANVPVTFTAPPASSGASCTFANSTAADTEMTNANGVATSATFTANTTSGPFILMATTPGATSAASFVLNNVSGPAAMITATGGTSQDATIGVPFATPLGVTVVDGDSNPVSGVTVTFTVNPASGASGTFGPNGATVIETTDAFGMATSPTVIANTTTGHYTVTASAGALQPAIFSLTNILPPLSDGSYVFSLVGQDVHGNYFVSGVFTVAGGLVTGGEQDFLDDQLRYGTDDQINPIGSEVSTTLDGNLLITLTTCTGPDCSTPDVNLGVNGVETFNGSLLPLNSKRAFLTEFDVSATSSGELDLQDPTAAAIIPSAGYAFSLTGYDQYAEGAYSITIGGVINVDGPAGSGTISGTNSVFDANDDFILFQGQTFAASTVTGPDKVGRVVFNLTPTDFTDFPPITLIGYIVDTNHIRLVETADQYQGTLGGTAFSQGANNGTFNSTSVAGSSYVVGLAGFDVTSSAASGASQAAGLITFNSNGTVSGFINYNDLIGTGPQAPSAITGGTYTVASTGDVTLTGVTSSNLPSPINLQLYLDGTGHALELTLDTTDELSGVGFQQGAGPFTASSFNGAYALNTTGFDQSGNQAFNAAGPVAANGSAGTFSGRVDISWDFDNGALERAPRFVEDEPLPGTFTSTTSGILAGTITGLDLTTCNVFSLNGTICTADAFNYYMIDAASAIAIETDSNQLTLGLFQQN